MWKVGPAANAEKGSTMPVTMLATRMLDVQVSVPNADAHCNSRAATTAEAID